jgi:aminoglycoside 6'-N-acetyltransferase
MLTLRPMDLDDLRVVRQWLGRPHVARWYLSDSTIDDEIEDMRLSVARAQPTEVLLAFDGAEPVGWCQWYVCRDYPDHAAGVGAEPNDVGIDYAIGEPGRVGDGLGTALIAALLQHVRWRHAGAGVIADPAAANVASRRVLEKNRFQLLGERSVPSESTSTLMAIYRLAA